MEIPTKWLKRLHRCIAGLSRNPAFRVPCRHFLRGCLGGVGALLLAGSFAQAATIHTGDILVVDASANKLFLVNPEVVARNRTAG
jgi:hypothetical protein